VILVAAARKRHLTVTKSGPVGKGTRSIQEMFASNVLLRNKLVQSKSVLQRLVPTTPMALALLVTLGILNITARLPMYVLKSTGYKFENIEKE
jgi:hypothetical protein